MALTVRLSLGMISRTEALAEVVPAAALAEEPQIPGAEREFALPLGFEQGDQLGDEVWEDEAEERLVLVHVWRVAGRSFTGLPRGPRSIREKGVPCRSHRRVGPGRRPREDAVRTLQPRDVVLAHARNVPPDTKSPKSSRSWAKRVVRSVTNELNRVTPAARQRSGVRHKETPLLMQIHRSRHARGFTVLPNTLLQDRRLSYTARGLLTDLLSRPDGWREDGRRMADTSPQGRLAVAKALRELTAFGYYRVERVRQPDGTFLSQAHVYDAPQAGPSAVPPDSGRSADGARGAQPVKDRGKEPTLPAQRTAPDTMLGAGAGGQRKTPLAEPTPVGPPNPAVGEAAALLHRVTAAEPRLRLGAAEALALAPLVIPWLERGHGPRDLAQALLSGLPEPVHSASALLHDRLTRKLPQATEPVAAPAKPRWYECTTCARPTPDEGICRTCAGLGVTPPEALDERARTAARGRALVGNALHGHRSGHLAARA